MSYNPNQENQGTIRWWHGTLFFLVALGVQFLIVFIIILAKSAGLFGDTPSKIEAAITSPGMITGQIAITSAGLTAIALFIPRMFRVDTRKWLGLQKPRTILVGLSLLGISSVGFLVDEVLFHLHATLPTLFDSAGLASLNTLFAKADPVSFLVLTIVVSLGPGIGEELFFRGFVLRAFASSWPKAIAVIASALLFGIMHIDPLQATGAGLIGLFLGFVVVRSGSVWTGVAAHGLNNLICALVARWDNTGSQEVWSQGHSAPLLICATVLTLISSAAIWKLTAKGHATQNQISHL